MKSLKKILALIVLTFGLLIGKQETAYGQFLIQDNDSCICYNTNQDKRALECLKNANSKDSLLTNSLVRIDGYKKVLDKDSKIIALNNEMIKKQKNRIKMIAIKLKISKRLTFVGVPTALIGGFLVGSMLSK